MLRDSAPDAIALRARLSDSLLSRGASTVITVGTLWRCDDSHKLTHSQIHFILTIKLSGYSYDIRHCID